MTHINPSSAGQAAIRWEDLPDPRDPSAPAGAPTAVVLDNRAWRHILGKHVLPARGPWGRVSSDQTFEHLLQVDTGRTFNDPVVTDAVKRLGHQIRS